MGAGYGLLAPLSATFDAVGEGKTNEFIHCIVDGTWTTILRSCTVVRDFTDVSFHSYFSVMDDLRLQEPPNGKQLEIRLLRLPGALLLGLLGIMIDMPVILVVALYKSPYMLFKGWHRLVHDLIGREGPFLETACVPFAGLAILLWPLAVIGGVLGSVISSFFLGAYASVIVYQESSIRLGMNYIISSLSIFDEYSNDLLDLPEGSCFPRRQYSKKKPSSRTSSFSRPLSLRKEKPDGKNPPSRSASFAKSIIEFKLLELLDRLIFECKQQGENMIREGLITSKDIEEYKYSKGGSRIISVGLPAYCTLQALVRSAKANSQGLLLSDNTTEITTENRPKDAIFDWFFNPLMIIKEQIKVANLSEAEENYLRRLVLLNGEPERLKSWNFGSPPDTERKRAEIDALSRRLQGITKSISRYPTFKRHFESLVDHLSEELAKKNGSRSTSRSKSGLGRILSLKSFGSRASTEGPDQEAHLVIQIQNGSEIV
ncbi:putative membrane protein At3g27390 isoform X2 [Tasmannia lanceolata]